MPKLKGLLFDLFVFGLRAAPTTILFEFDFAFDKLAVFARPIIDAAAFAARELDELILRHSRRTIAQRHLLVN
jgi:hypothetical protein